MAGFDFSQILRQRKQAGLYRSRITLESRQAPEVWCNGKKHLAFCSNNYLGLADHPKIISTFQQAANKYGTGGGASHLVIGHQHPHHQLEEELAAFTGRERALLFGSGYMANLGVITAILGRSDGLFLDRFNHASLVDAGLLSRAKLQRFRHLDSQHLEALIQGSSADQKLIATDGVFSMDGDMAPLSELADIADRYNACLMVDDAHGFGYLGHNGGGVAESFSLSQDRLPILMGTLSKAFGLYGAFVAGSHELIETLIQYARSYIYTTSLPPAVAEAGRVSLQIVQQDSWRREHLKQLIDYFRQGCAALDIRLMSSETPIQPLLVGSASKAVAMSNTLAKQGILVTAIRPPTVPVNTARLRFSFSAAHTKGHIDRLLEALAQIKQDTVPGAALP